MDTTWGPGDSPVRITSSVTVPQGVTLTIEPGTTVDFTNSFDLAVQGTLTATDATFNGFVNGSDLDEIIVSAGGAASITGGEVHDVRIVGSGSLSLVDALVENSNGRCLDLLAAPVAISGCDFSQDPDWLQLDLAAAWLDAAAWDALRANITGNTYHPSYSLLLGGGTIQNTCTISPIDDAPFTLVSGVTVPGGVTLTIEDSALVFSSAWDVLVQGQLLVSGTTFQGASFSDADDLIIEAGGSATITSGEVHDLRIAAFGALSLAGTLLENGNGRCVELHAAAPSISGCDFTQDADWLSLEIASASLDEATMAAIRAGITGNSYHPDSAVWIGGGTVQGSYTLAPIEGQPFWLSQGFAVGAGATMTLQDAVMTFSQQHDIVVNGQLVATGSTINGFVNGSDLDEIIVAAGGTVSISGGEVHDVRIVSSGSLSLVDALVENSNGRCLDLLAPPVAITGCDFSQDPDWLQLDLAAAWLDAAAWDALRANITGNTYHPSYSLLLGGGTIQNTCTLSPIDGAPFTLVSGVTVPGGVTLTIEDSAVVFSSAWDVLVQGQLLVSGTTFQGATFSDADDLIIEAGASASISGGEIHDLRIAAFGALSLTGTFLENSNGRCVDLSSGPVAITGCDFSQDPDWLFLDLASALLDADAMDVVRANISGNAYHAGTAVWVGGGTVQNSYVLSAVEGQPFWLFQGFTVGAAATMTVQDAVFNYSGQHDISVSGDLVMTGTTINGFVNGSDQDEVIITPGGTMAITGGEVHDTRIVAQGPLSMVGCLAENTNGRCVDLHAGPTAITGCDFSQDPDWLQLVVSSALLDDVAMDAVLASVNGNTYHPGNVTWVGGGTIQNSFRLAPIDEAAFLFTASITVPDGVSLTVEDAEFSYSGIHDITVNGQLSIAGSVLEGFASSDGDEVIIGVGGSASITASELGSLRIVARGPLSLTGSTMENANGHCVDLHAVPVAISGCDFSQDPDWLWIDLAGTWLEAAAMQAVQANIVDNIHHDANQVQVAGGTLTRSFTLGAVDSQASYLLSGSITVPSAITLTLDSIALRMTSSHDLLVSGDLVVAGSMLSGFAGNDNDQVLISSSGAATFANASVENCMIQNSGSLSVSSCALGNATGSEVVNEAGGTAVITGTNFLSSGNFAIDNNSVVEVSAEDCHWLSADGPGGAGPGTGAPIDGPVDFLPFSTTPRDFFFLELFSVSDDTGTRDTPSPGAQKRFFAPGEFARVTFRAISLGAAVDAVVSATAELKGNPGQFIYDSHDPALTPSGFVEDNSADSPLELMEWDYYSFDIQVPSDAGPGQSHDIAAMLRSAAPADELLDATGNGPNSGLVAGRILPNYLNVLGGSGTPGGTPLLVTNLHASQRTDGSGIVDIVYDLSGATGTADVSISISRNNGLTWDIIPSLDFVAGDIGPGVPNGTGHSITWDVTADRPGVYWPDCRVRLVAVEQGS